MYYRDLLRRFLQVVCPTQWFRFGCNDYTLRTHTCGELRLANVGKQVTLYGWLQYKRGNIFLVLRDAYGRIQVKVPSERKDLVKLLKRTYLESIIKVHGVVVDRAENRNSSMETGDVEVVVEELEVVNSVVDAKEMPYSLRFEQSDALELRYRYIHLRSEGMQRNLRLRAKVVREMRNYLDNEACFVEIETPTLVRRTPGGAKEFIVPAPFPNLGHFYSLPQSPQQFKQLLMCGGFDRYYQFARCFRDERSKSDRQPEFTQVDLELSFTNQEGVMLLVEDLIASSWPYKEKRPITPFRRMSFEEAYRLYGIDKPDLRIPWTIIDCTECFSFLRSDSSTEFCARLFVAKGALEFVSEDKVSEWRMSIETHPKFKEFKVAMKSNLQWFEHISNDSVAKNYEMDEDDVLVLSWGCPIDVQWTLGQLRNMVGNAMNLRKEKVFEFVWITDFPLFFRQNDGTFKCAHHPFTAPIAVDAEALYDPAKVSNVKGQHYDLVLNGVELGGGSIRIHDAQLQSHVIENILQQPVEQLKHLIDALSCGAPPHGGFALGLDRYIAILATGGDTNVSIRDVIAFPKDTEKRDIMIRSPAVLSDESIERYGILLNNSLIKQRSDQKQ